MLDQFKEYIASLPAGSLTKEHLLVPDLLLKEKGELKIYYAPMDYINERAQITIIGITPGFTQMELAIRQARQDLMDRIDEKEIDKRARFVASLAGSMRRNLIQMLDELGLPEVLGLVSSSSLFAEHRDLLHTTAVIRYPVFIKGKNYTGHNPDILQSEILTAFALELLERDLKATKQALIIPLGKSVTTVLQAFAAKGELEADRCLFDFPHPSGANGHRKTQFESCKDQHQKQISEWFAKL